MHHIHISHIIQYNPTNIMHRIVFLAGRVKLATDIYGATTGRIASYGFLLSKLNYTVRICLQMSFRPNVYKLQVKYEGFFSKKKKLHSGCSD